MKTFYFYDLETSGFNPRTSRIMQFAGQRTNMDLEPIGEPNNILIKLTDDILPEPDAVLVTGITPQKTLSDGITEYDFLRIFDSEISINDTIFVGFNSVRFDDEFMRFTLYRNYYDSYEWQWKEGRSRWDLLDVARMTRALRPDGIEWPFDTNGKPSNQLGLLTSVNKLNHDNAR
jgi:exodeoxyribonuclease I